jgi:hypothetical protein
MSLFWFSGWLKAANRKPGASRRNPRRPPQVEALEERTLLTGSWTPLNNLAPSVAGTMMLLSDGTVMAQGGDTTWYKLTPDSSGGYVNGTWTQLASMNVARLYFASNVLRDGRVFLVGGEYSGLGSSTNTGEIFDPVADSWTLIPDFSQPYFGDDPSELLPDGRVLAGYIFGPQTYIYDPAANTWSFAANKLRNDRSDEETWVKLPDDSILSYDIFASIETGVSTAQRYIPAQNQWVDAGVLPVQLSSWGIGAELGPALLLNDGRVFLAGANGNTALYTPSTNTWVAGPQIVGTLNGRPVLFGADDAPGAVLPNGHVLFAADAGPTLGTFSAPTELFDFDPNANRITPVSVPDPNLPSQPAFVDRMLMLPTGQVLFSDGSSQLWVYTPNGAAKNSWRPKIRDVQDNGDGTFTLTGTQLNGMSAGAAYGDDAEMDSNYPIVQLTGAHGNVFYARTFNWSSTGVATGTAPETVSFVLPPGVAAGNYFLTVSGAGISSHHRLFRVTSAEATLAASGSSPLAGGEDTAPSVRSLAFLSPASADGAAAEAAELPALTWHGEV